MGRKQPPVGPPGKESFDSLPGLSSIWRRCTTTFRCKFDLLVDRRNPYVTVNRSQVEDAGSVADLRQNPLFALAYVVLNADFVLGYQDILAERIETAVVRELLPAVVGLGRLR